MAEVVTESFSAGEWPYRVAIPLMRLSDNIDNVIGWLAQPEVPGRAKWDWYSGERKNGEREILLIVGFDDPNAAFEFKLRWA